MLVFLSKIDSWEKSIDSIVGLTGFTKQNKTKYL